MSTLPANYSLRYITHTLASSTLLFFSSLLFTTDGNPICPYSLLPRLLLPVSVHVNWRTFFILYSNLHFFLCRLLAASHDVLEDQGEIFESVGGCGFGFNRRSLRNISVHHAFFKPFSILSCPLHPPATAEVRRQNSEP
jgi:hypothetical protein